MQRVTATRCVAPLDGEAHERTHPNSNFSTAVWRRAPGGLRNNSSCLAAGPTVR